MKYAIPVFCALISGILVLVLTPWLIRYLNRIGLVVKDMNKKDKPLVPISGGLAVTVGIIGGLTCFIFFRTFFPSSSVAILMDEKSTLYLFAVINTLIVISFIGFIDDLIIRKSKESSAGLKQWQKPILTLAAAVPLMVVNAGITTMGFPIFGQINVGLLYPLLLVPLGVVGASNMVNMFAGFNGLETGMGIVYTGMLGLYTFYHGRLIATMICLVAFFALVAFYKFNSYPARILPGDSLTYLLGALLACIAIVGNIEKAVLVISIPFFIEFLLKAKSKFKAQTYGYWKNGKVKTDYKKIYSLPHILTRTGKFTEKQIVYTFVFLQLFFALLIWFV